MFQVASHPSAFGLHTHGHHASVQSSHSGPSPSSLQLPRSLTRPPYSEVSREAIIAAEPELMDVPAEYIRRGLRQKASHMLAGISSLGSSIPSSVPSSHLPHVLTVPVRYAPGVAQPSYPTHVIAVRSSKPSPNQQIMLFPIHGVVLASHCASLPRLPPSASQRSHSTLDIPVISISLPSPAAFSIIHSFMYSHRLDAVLKAILPVPSGFLQTLSHHAVQAALNSNTTRHQLSSYLYSSSPSGLKGIMGHAGHVKELWQDMCALGIHDPELWDTLDLAWEVILGALNLAAASGH